MTLIPTMKIVHRSHMLWILMYQKYKVKNCEICKLGDPEATVLVNNNKIGSFSLKNRKICISCKRHFRMEHAVLYAMLRLPGSAIFNDLAEVFQNLIFCYLKYQSFFIFNTIRLLFDFL